MYGMDKLGAVFILKKSDPGRSKLGNVWIYFDYVNVFRKVDTLVDLIG